MLRDLENSFQPVALAALPKVGLWHDKGVACMMQCAWSTCRLTHLPFSGNSKIILELGTAVGYSVASFLVHKGDCNIEDATFFSPIGCTCKAYCCLCAAWSIL